MIFCDRKTAELMISESLSADDTDKFEEHVATCNVCQQMLMEVAGGASALQVASSMLSSSMEMPNWSDQPTMALSPVTGALAYENPVQHTVDLSMLGPTDDPDSMGRIGNYEIQGIIGRGGMGIVFRAVDSALSRNVALKVLDPSLASVSPARKRFAMEARAMAAISHEHVVPVYTVDEHRGLPYFAMEYVPGGTLESRIRKQGPLDVLSILRIGRQVALALSAAHECGLVHRDIKPANILLDRGVDRVRVADFGLARVNSDASHTRSGFIAGTPQYMSPEQVRGETCTPQSDLFSLGTVMYAMCTGHSPFRSESIYGSMQRIVHEAPRSICEQSPAIPDWLEGFVFKLLSKKTSDRFPDAITVARLLEAEAAYAENPTINAKPPRQEYGLAERSRSVSPLGMRTALFAGLGIVCLAIWPLLPTANQPERIPAFIQPFVAPSTIESAGMDSTRAWLNDDQFVQREDVIRQRASVLEQSYLGGDRLPIADPFDSNLRRLKQALDAFEKASKTDN